ncbi:MAG TPA: PEP/pyruvate-binding domain-containing protein [Rhizomicrobium sp.]|nr:PEP/pyruvate-binding domain-containing protein [Rhizomicrobium sp.]
MRFIIPLREATPQQAPIIGNKAAGLANLIVAGFRVPNGFCVTTDVYSQWRRGGALSDEMRAELKRAFASVKPPLAVRSSSPAEDRADASFAGQYKTVLGVRTEDEFFAALETCWESTSSQGALAYRKVQGAEADVEMAVVVQQLIPATQAGVLFTLHPVTDRVDQIVVNANYGIGESVVSGRAEPDTYIASKASGEIVESTLGAKALVSRQTDRGVIEVENDPALRTEFCLSAGQVRELADVARKLEAHYDMPMDAEWAFEDGVLHLLQARPVTTGLEAYYTDLLDQWARDRGLEFDPEAIWARGSPLSGLPVSPLYYSEMAAFFSDMFPRVAQLHGAAAATRKSFRYFKGYTYSDVTFSSVADPSGEIQPISLFGPEWRSNVMLGLRYPATLAFWCNIGAYYRNWYGKWLPAIEAQRPDYATAKPHEIRKFIDFIEDQRRERSIFAALGVAYASNFLGLLMHLLERWTDDSAADTVGVLTSGVPDSLTHDENLEVGELADAATATQEVRELILKGAYAQLENSEDGRVFLQKLDAFRARRPHRGCSDRDLYQPRWGDDRKILLNQVASILSLSRRVDPHTAHARTAAKRIQREDEVLRQVGRGIFGPIRRAVFKRVMRATQRYWIYRDNQRHSFDRYFYELRNAYRALGERFVEDGALNAADDVFFAAKTEIYDHLDARLAADRLCARAKWRHDWWNRVKEQAPAPMLKGNLPHQRDAVKRDLGEGDFGGVGGAPGVVTGPVRLVETLAELGSVTDGDILVTHAIDPAWTPVFGIIGGVISEEGGILSHATVLGREYGLPVVIGVAGAASELKTGDMVEVDGTTGIVRRIQAEDEPDMTEECSSKQSVA